MNIFEFIKVMGDCFQRRTVGCALKEVLYWGMVPYRNGHPSCIQCIAGTYQEEIATTHQYHALVTPSQSLSSRPRI